MRRRFGSEWPSPVLPQNRRPQGAWMLHSLPTTNPASMRSKPASPPRLTFAVIALLAVGAQLLRELQQGGIVSHHLLARADLPAVSNAWGLLVLPMLAAWAAGRWPGRHLPWLLGFALPLLLGLALSAAFTMKLPAVTEALFLLALLLALLLPAHRAETLLGFVFGMGWAFGAVLPLTVGGVIALLSWLVREMLRRGWRLLRPA